MQPGALKAGCRGPAVHAGRRDQTRPLQAHESGPKGHGKECPRFGRARHETNSLKSKSQRPNHIDQHMPKQAHHKCSPGRGIVNDGSAPCATILPRHPESRVGPRPCTLGCVYPGALHHATAILILPSRYVAVTQRPASNRIQFIFATDQPTPPWARTTYGRRTTVWTRRDVSRMLPMPTEGLTGEHRPPRLYQSEAISH